MKTYSIITRSDYEEYMLRVYFGRGDYLSRCIDRAYRDFNRTLHGLRRIRKGDELYEKATDRVKLRLDALKKSNVVRSQTAFDKWHRTTCLGLIQLYKKFKYPRFYVGQAQKWVNMTLKYIFTMGDSRIKGFGRVYRFCHIPIDKIVLERLNSLECEFPVFSVAWSRINNYGEYLEFQKWFRNAFKMAPLDAEFKLWMGEHPK